MKPFFPCLWQIGCRGAEGRGDRRRKRILSFCSERIESATAGISAVARRSAGADLERVAVSGMRRFTVWSKRRIKTWIYEEISTTGWWPFCGHLPMFVLWLPVFRTFERVFREVESRFVVWRSSGLWRECRVTGKCLKKTISNHVNIFTTCLSFAKPSVGLCS